MDLLACQLRCPVDSFVDVSSTAGGISHPSTASDKKKMPD